MKVDIAVHGRFHAFELARGLQDRGLLGTLRTTYPAFAVRRVVGPVASLSTAPHLELIRRFGQWSGSFDANNYILPKFGQFVAQNIQRSQSDVLVGWSSATLEAITFAQAAGKAVVIDRGASHIRSQNIILNEAYREAGLEFPGIPRNVMDREEAEYEAADKILVPSTHAASSFRDNNVPAEKVAVVPLGVDFTRFSADRTAAKGGKPRIVFVGSVGIRKGSHHLLNAFSRLGPAAELHLVGPMDSAFKTLLSSLPVENVVFHGALAKDRLASIYSGADVFCLPSIEEGFGMVVLEAMASGLPVVVSDQVGAADAVTHGESGYISPVNDIGALAGYLAELVGSTERRRQMGASARLAAAKLENNWDGYIDRVVPELESLIRRSS